MKNLTRFISGIAASLLLATGLNAAAEKLDPVTHDTGSFDPTDSTNEKGKISALPCEPCAIDQ
jgi:hypothetical protein